MRENESDSGDNWPEPHDYTGPWAAREEGAADQAPAPGDHQDTVAFGGPAGEADGPGQGSYVQRGNLDPWYGSDRDEPRYGRYAGPGSGGGSASAGEYASGGGYASAGGHGSAGGWGSEGGRWDPGPPPRRARRRRHLLIYLTVAALAAGVGAALTVAFDGQGTSPSATTSSSTGIPSPHDNAAGSGSALNPAAVERKVKPGMVEITSTLKYASETAEGTGMILSRSGLVLTNNHVIDGATEVRVRLADSLQIYPAQVVGYDSTADVALLKLTGVSGLATVSFGNSSQVRVGTPVLALGDAQGRGRLTAAPGEISGLNRSIQASDEGSGTTEDLNHMLQTNADIQQGDSGGALANNAGQVIGMVTAANTGSGGQPGSSMGFAIPINTALAIAQKIADHRASSTVYIGLPGFLGVVVAQSDSASPRRQAADEAQTGNGQGGASQGGASQGGRGPGRAACVPDGQQPGVPVRIAPAASGALILGVLCGTAAQSRGLAAGDVIISVDGQAITTPDSLTAITAKYHPGHVVSVGWEDIRGSRHAAQITLGDGPPR